jgi:hypothetical protein
MGGQRGYSWCHDRDGMYLPHKRTCPWNRVGEEMRGRSHWDAAKSQSTCPGLVEGMLVSCNEDSLHAALVFLRAARSSEKVAQ